MSDRVVSDLPIPGLEFVFNPAGVSLIDKGAPRPTISLAVHGDAGAGKTTTAVAVAHAVARDLGGALLYLTTELASTELAYKTQLLSLEGVQVLNAESAGEARPGDIVAQHLVLFDEAELDATTPVEVRALQAALRLTDPTKNNVRFGVPICCVVVDAFPMPEAPLENRTRRDEIVALLQTLEGRGISVIIVDEDDGMRDYVPFVVDIVFELRFERDAQSGELLRRIACRKSRYTRALPGPHDAGMDYGRPAVWPNLLAALPGNHERLAIDSDAAEFVLPAYETDKFVLLARSAILISPYDRGSPLLKVLRAVPGARITSVRCGPSTVIDSPDSRGIVVPDWEGPYSIGWALLRVCRERRSNVLVIQSLEALLGRPRFQHALLHVLEALKALGLILCIHGENAALSAVAPVARYVWGGAQSGIVPVQRSPYRLAADWLALESWPVTVRPGSKESEQNLVTLRQSLARFHHVASLSGSSEAKAALPDRARTSTDTELAAAAQVALAHHLMGFTETAARFLPDPENSAARLVSNALALSVMDEAWSAARLAVQAFQQNAEGTSYGAERLWTALTAMHTANKAAVERLQSEVSHRAVLLPLLVRALAARGRLADLDTIVADVCKQTGTPEFLADLIQADARLLSSDASEHDEAERRLSKMLENHRLPQLHAANVWHNLGALSSLRGGKALAVERWTRALRENPWLDASRRSLEDAGAATSVPEHVP